jgi:outer membrane protein assembly factor BamB
MSSPAVANGIVYVGALDTNVYAFNANTGALIWSFPTVGEVFQSPAVANGVVYVGTFGGLLYALNASTGALLGSLPIGYANTAPVVADGVVYIGGWESGAQVFAFGLPPALAVPENGDTESANLVDQ